MLKLTIKEKPNVPLEAESISPDAMAGLTLDAARALPLFLGKRQCRLDEFFTVDGEPGDEIEIHGDAGRVKWIGRGMTRGHIRIIGNAGMHLGAYMKGGTIFLLNGAELRTGAWMSRGTIVSLAPIPLLPTFSFACAYNPPFLRLYAAYLRTLGFTIPCDPLQGAYRRYTGDTCVPGK